jgi:hypothetical protein
MQGLEEHLVENRTFNRGNRPRRVWQNGLDPEYSRRYILSSPLFLLRSASNQQVSLTYEPHPWLISAVQQHNKYIINPNRPTTLVLADNELLDLEDGNPPEFQRNDIVWISFTISFIVGREYWQPEYRPIDIVRVGRLPVSEIDNSGGTTVASADTDIRRLKVGPIRVHENGTFIQQYNGGRHICDY